MFNHSLLLNFAAFINHLPVRTIVNIRSCKRVCLLNGQFNSLGKVFLSPKSLCSSVEKIFMPPEEFLHNSIVKNRDAFFEGR